MATALDLKREQLGKLRAQIIFWMNFRAEKGMSLEMDMSEKVDDTIASLQAYHNYLVNGK